MAGKAMQLGGKIFWFNIQTSKNGAQYLSIVGDHKGSKEKLTLFPNQIPSFSHMVRETYTEMIRNMDLDDMIVDDEIVAPVTPVKAKVVVSTDAELRACPQCGVDGSEELKPDISLRNGGSLVSVNCIDGCGYSWPEGESNWGSMLEASKIWDRSWLIEVFKRWR